MAAGQTATREKAGDAGLGPNAPLIGKPGSRALVATPALILDLDCFERNIQRMADHCRSSGLALRPHAKTHKSAAVARAQIAAGAAGICCAKLGEAEALAGPGIDDILLTSPIVADRAIDRLVTLHRRVARLAVVVDHPEPLDALGFALTTRGGTDKPLTVLVDLDVGTRRTGVTTEEEALILADAIESHPGLVFGGLQAYAGHLQHVEAYDERRRKSEEALARAQDFRDALEAAGFAVSNLTGGGTGTHDIDAALGHLTELQAGSYIFMDRQYNAVHPAGNAVEESVGPAFETALFVQATVVSANQRGFVTTDAGFKSFAMDGPRPEIAQGAPEGARYIFMGDEHGGVRFADEGQHLPVGATVTLVTPHCDPTVNLYDTYHCVRGDVLVDIWPIEARGRSQ